MGTSGACLTAEDFADTATGAVTMAGRCGGLCAVATGVSCDLARDDDEAGGKPIGTSIAEDAGGCLGPTSFCTGLLCAVGETLGIGTEPVN